MGHGKRIWGPVFNGVSAITHAVAYDRAGYGQSEVSPQARSGLQIVVELRAMLQTQGFTPPYVLVGHSLGGTFMKLFAKHHPDEIAGVVLVEAYDLGAGNSPRMVNVSARNRVGTGDDILIAGFNLAGTGPTQLLIRAVGPKLGAFGVTGFLANPKLEVYSGAGVKLTENDDWGAALATTFNAVGAFPLDIGSRDAALLTSLEPGTYTVQVSGVGGGTGEALIEIYEVK